MTTLASQLRRVISEIGYADRRLFSLRTGITLEDRRRPGQPRRGGAGA